MKKILTIISTTIMVATLTACNTFEGAGKDIETGGEKIQEASQNVKNNM